MTRVTVFAVILLLNIVLPISQANAQGAPAPQPAVAPETKSTESPEKEHPSELDLPEDQAIKLKVQPLISNSVVDRIGETVTITVDCPGAANAEIFIVGVDAPYGGRALERPRSLGADSNPTDGLSIQWSQPECDQYVKVFAVVTRKSQPEKRIRSHTIDLAMYGIRFKPKPATPVN